MMWIGQGIAFGALVAGAAYLEVHGKHADGLWALIVVWCISIGTEQMRRADG